MRLVYSLIPFDFCRGGYRGQISISWKYIRISGSITKSPSGRERKRMACRDYRHSAILLVRSAIILDT